ncbi:hypothetical protein PENSPDRAFT_489059 [Peniophora sp. CONT]|nr:hypothetical protein PENSPDRAFT_489059 [Peniophora sp. CONT]
MNSGQSFERRLLEGPTAALNHFRALWDNRASGIIQEKSELCDALKVLATHFERKSADASGRQSPLVRPGNDIWDAVVVAELPLLLENIMAENDFFLNCQVWIEGVMLCLAAIVHACHWACHDQPRRIPFPETMSRHFLREGSRNIWTSGWQNRERIVSIENRQHLPLLTRILAMFNIIYEYDAHKVAMKTCSPDLGRLALFVWFHTPRTALVKHRHAAFLTFSSIFIPMDFGKDQRYLKTVVSDSAVGAVPLMSNILATIGTDELLLDGELENFVSIIEALLSFYSEQRPQFFALPILHSLVLGMARQRRDGGSDWEAGIRVWGAIQRILRRIKQGLRDGICPVRLVNGQDVMEVLVQGAATVYALLLYSDKPQRDERAALVGVDGSEQLVGSGDGSVDEDEGESTDQEGGSDDHEGDTEDTDNENFGVQGVDYEGDYSGDEKDGNGHGADEEDSDGEVASEEDVDEEEK